MTLQKPLVLICSIPLNGHIIPMIETARQLVSRGHDVCFVTAGRYRRNIEDIGASFVPVQGYGDLEHIKKGWKDLNPHCEQF